MTRTIAVRNPRTGELDYEIKPPDETQLTALCDRLRLAQDDWHQSGLGLRIETLQTWKQILSDSRSALVSALIRDTGRQSVSELEFDSLLNMIDRWCRLAPSLLQPTEQVTAIPFIQLRQATCPYAVVGIISPWNFPLLLSTLDLIPALLAGCAAIVKPSEITPRFIAPLMATIAQVPSLQEVLHYVPGDGATGAAMLQQVDAICFTGSVATGRRVAEQAAQRFIPAFLELGGKDPAIVLASADLDRASSAILWGATVNSGQSCLSIERIYVAETVLEPFVDQLVAKAKTVALAYPEVDSGPLGPIIAARQAEIIQAQLDDADRQGAIAHCGGHVETLAGGLWCRPTVLTQVHHQMAVMTEETFGPIMPVMAVESPKVAIALANDSAYGLSAAVFAGSTDEALAVGQRLHAGAVSINDAALTALIYDGEKQSFKLSGLGGSRMGPSSIQRFLRKQAFLVNTGSAADPWWFTP